MTESQNSWDWKGTLGPPGPIPAQAGSYGAGSQDHVLVTSADLQGENTTYLGKLCQCSAILTAQKCFLMVGR